MPTMGTFHVPTTTINTGSNILETLKYAVFIYYGILCYSILSQRESIVPSPELQPSTLESGRKRTLILTDLHFL